MKLLLSAAFVSCHVRCSRQSPRVRCSSTAHHKDDHSEAPAPAEEAAVESLPLPTTPQALKASPVDAEPESTPQAPPSAEASFLADSSHRDDSASAECPAGEGAAAIVHTVAHDGDDGPAALVIAEEQEEAAGEGEEEEEWEEEEEEEGGEEEEEAEEGESEPEEQMYTLREPEWDRAPAPGDEARLVA